MVELVILWLLFVKHCYVDFTNQTNEEIQHKGIYGDWLGIKHSFKHGVGTAIVFAMFINVFFAIAIGIIDALIHYHVDYVKSYYGEKNINSKKFWNQFGLDQLAHYTTYLLLLAIIV